MWTGATEAMQQGMTNVAFLRTKIELLPYFFAEGEVAEVWITFPDPQMRKVNKRLTSTRFMQHYSRVLRPDGIIHLKCDSPFLYTYTEAMIEHNHLPLIWKTTDLYGPIDATQVPAEVDLEALRSIRTYYESQWLARGISIKYLGWQLQHSEPWQEPEIEIELDSYRSFGRDKRSSLETHA
jgi:tRNA (guanine-N7-)-methyltransferase